MPRWWLTGAGLWAGIILGVAAVVPTYGSSAATSSVASSAPGPAPTTVTVHTTSATLIQVNGLRVLIPLAVPLLVVAVVAFLLPRHRRLAWAITAVLAALNMLAMLSVGVFLLPITVLLIVACSQSHAPAAAAAGGASR